MAKALSKPESNLKKLTKSPIPMNFVKKHNATWNHQDWLDFLDYLKEKNYFPIDTDKVGLLLEERRSTSLSRTNNILKEHIAYPRITVRFPPDGARGYVLQSLWNENL